MKLIWIVSFFWWSLAAQAEDVAVVGGKGISLDAFQSAISVLTPEEKKQLQTSPQQLKILLDSYIQSELLFRAAENKNFYEKAPWKQFSVLLMHQLMGDFYVKMSVATLTTQEMLFKFYEQHKHRYTTDKVRVFDISLVDSKRGDEVVKEIKARKRSFAQLSDLYNDSSSLKKVHGDMGFVGTQQLSLYMMDIIFKSPPNRIYGPVFDGGMFHVIYVMNRSRGRQISFNEVRNTIKAEIEMIQSMNLIESFKKEIPVTINQEVLKKIEF